MSPGDWINLYIPDASWLKLFMNEDGVVLILDNRRILQNHHIKANYYHNADSTYCLLCGGHSIYS